nr:MAG TPA: minor tail protein [Caudoviricetes sp.]
MGYDGTVKIGTELDGSGIKKGLQETEKSAKKTFEELAKESGKSVNELKADAKKIAEEYQKQGYNIPNSYKKAYSDMGVYSEKSKKKLEDDAEDIGDSHEKNSRRVSETWSNAFSVLLGNMLTEVVSQAKNAAGAVLDIGMNFESGMSKVQAISGASGEDLAALTDKAKEMGAKTKFSATESAEAMQYMAMAGWKTGDMLNGIEGIMNLAAASGEDLATTSDIVTDALTAFGLSAQDSTHFADVLAQASSNANTNVGMMGETFKYVAPVAGAMGYSAEDVATAIGLMANSGIKASQAGTSLRTILTRMAKPTKEVQTAMDQLGVSVIDSDGNMKSLHEIMDDLRSGFSGLSEAEKVNMAATLGETDGMSGLLAIVNASDRDYQKLTDSINNCSGAAESMAETMQDNLEGQLTILGSTAESLALEIYESVKGPLTDMTKLGIDAVSNLTEGFETGGVMGMIDAAGQMASAFAENLPSIIEQGLPLIEGFTENLRSNAGKLVDGGIELMLNLAQGLMDGLPAMLQHIPQIVINIAGIINDNAPKLLMAGVELIGILAKGLIQAIPDLIAALPQIIQAIAATIQAFNWLALGSNIITLLKNGIMSMVGAVQSAGTGIFNAVKGAIQNLPQTLLSIGKSGGTGILNGLKGMAGSIKGAATSILTGIVSALTSLPSKLLGLAKNGAQSIVKGFTGQSWGNIGKNIITGITAGITGSVGKLAEAAKNAAKKAFDAAKDFLGIHSPSKLMRDVIGKNMIAGFESGIVAETPNLEKTSAGSAQRAVESMQGIALQRSGTVVAGNQVPPAPTPGGGQGSTVVVLEKGSITGEVTMDGEKVGTLVAPTVDTEIERARKESER